MQKHIDALEAALTAAHSSPSYEATQAVKAARKALSDAICDGAKPCDCGASDMHGMRQPLAKGKHEFEVGCLACGARARGGLIPRHAVEAWNEGVRS